MFYLDEKMDKLTTISATLFMAADIFAIISLAMPDWVIDAGGKWKFYFLCLPKLINF